MVKNKMELYITMERYPCFCRECPAFYTSEYCCHNERGQEGYCRLGYMSKHDTRDFNGKIMWEHCRITENPNVSIEPIEIE